MPSKLLPLLLLVLLAASARATAGALDDWQWSNPLPEASTLSSVTCGNGTFVAVGAGGTIVASPDGLNWGAVNSGTAGFTSVAYLNGTFVAVGYSGAICTSTDSLTWTSQNSGSVANLFGVAYGNGSFVAVGLAGAILKSADSVHWTAATSGNSNDLYGVAFTNGIFAAVGDDATIVTSTNATTWSVSTLAGFPVTLNSITSGSGTFVAVGSIQTIVTSTNGISWASQSSVIPGPNITCVAYGSGTFAAIDQSGNFEVSTDGVTWTAATSISGTTSGIACGDGKFVAVGSGQDASGDTYGTMWSSPNGNTWTPGNTAVTYQGLEGAGFGNGTFVTVGDNGTILTSTDGFSWAVQGAGVTADDLYSVTYGNGLFVAVGNNVILTSSDAVTWATPTLANSYDFQGVVFGSGTFVAVTQEGDIATSTDGTTWSSQNIGAFYNLTGVAYGNGIFVAVGSGLDFPEGTFGTTLSSTDGVTWTVGNPGTASTLTGVAYSSGTFVAVGAGGVLGSSTDGLSWVGHNSQTTNDLNGITSGNGIFLAIGNGGALVSSSDGALWTLRDPSAANPQQLYAAGYGYGTFVAVGTNGTILQSQGLPGAGPTVTTGTASSLTTTTAVLNATVNPNGASTSVSFEYSTSPIFVAPLFTSGTNIGAGSAALPVSLPAAGLIPGTTYYFRAFATNANGLQYGGIVTLTTASLPPVITSGTSAVGTDGAAFTYQIAASNNPVSYDAMSLPAGLTVDTSTGLISGTVNTTGTFAPVIYAINTGGTGSATLTITIVLPVPAITSALNVTGTDGFAFSYQIAGSNNPTAYSAQNLPPGLDFSASTGLISGTPDQTGTFSATVGAINTGGTGSATVTMIVLPTPPMITSSLSVSASTSYAFTYQIAATNNPTSFSAGGLPPGITCDTFTGLISGTPSQTGTFVGTIAAGNLGGTDTEPFTVTVVPPSVPPWLVPVIDSTLTASGTAGSAFSYQIAATNNPTMFGATGLPAGLTVDASSGLISGTPLQSGTFAVNLSAGVIGGTGYATLNLAVTANFKVVHGSFKGLGAVSGTNLGLFTLSLMPTGGFSAKLTGAGAHYPLKGAFTSYGSFAKTLTVGKASLAVALEVNTSLPAVSGTIATTTSGTTTTYTVNSALLGSFKASTLPTGLMGRFTSIIPPLSGMDPLLPNGPGYATMSVTSTGSVKLAGKLGDGTPLNVTAQLNSDGKTWTLFELLYAGKHPGSIAGTMTFESLTDSDCDGTVDWIKPAQTTGAYYPGGFLANVDLTAAKYVAPPVAAGPASFTVPSLAITDGLTISATYKVAVTGTNDTAITLTPGTGAFSGSFHYPGTDKKTTFDGVIYQKPSPPVGYGLFLGTGQTGDLEISQ